MKIALIIVSALLLISLTYGYLSTVESNTTIRNKETEVRYHRLKANEFKARFDSLYEADSPILQKYGESIQRAEIAEQRARKAELALKHEIRNNRTFSDAVTDSLLAEIR